MAKDKKSTRSFDLEKGGKRSFELEKKSTRSFDLKKDEEEVAVPITPGATDVPKNKQEKAAIKSAEVPQSSTTPMSNGNGYDRDSKKQWLWISLIIAVLAALAYFFILGGRPEASDTDVIPTEIAGSDSYATNAESSTPADSVEEAASSEIANDETAQAGLVPENVVLEARHPSNTDTHVASQQSEKTAPVTARLSTGSFSSADVDNQARQVIKGVYGNNPERRQKLGVDYEAIQKRVNELMRR
ncbi:MAG: hypothetical protein K2G86_10070 [Prevotella sp.]|nr:hypothetical protein [Prevotella sp.]